MPPYDLGNNKPTRADVAAARATRDAAKATMLAAAAAYQAAAAAFQAAETNHTLVYAASGSDQ